jgi:hypothetical protein
MANERSNLHSVKEAEPGIFFHLKVVETYRRGHILTQATLIFISPPLSFQELPYVKDDLLNVFSQLS